MLKHLARAAAAGLAGVAAFGTLAASPASARSARVERRGTCSRGSEWKVKLGLDGSAVETEFEVDGNRVGQTWNVAITDNGVRVFSGSRTTTAPSGSFTVSRRIPNRAGTDNVVASAK